ncbi:restriction endonuclease subunit S [Shewanella oncorhynchi]|uniref:restriction endonuclease subunit S n=1 Tax=Shewanella oncorhynchi TaxID=2726434 RepID=UPI003D7AA197
MTSGIYEGETKKLANTSNSLGLVAYKKTELGVLPNDWSVEQFKDVTQLITCGIAATPIYVQESVGYPFLSSTNVKNGRIVWKNFKYITSELHKRLYKNNPPLRGDVLYSRVGTIGEAAVIEDDFEFSVYVSLTLIKPTKAILNSYFLSHLLNSVPYKNRANEQVYLGGGVGNLNVDVVRSYPIPIPPLGEQTAIANALSDVDALIRELEKLIAKKQAIKTATMQQLLTGRTRLPAFAYEKSAHHLDGRKKGYKSSELGEIPEDWEVVSFGELGQIDPENLGAGTAPDYEFDYVSLEQIDKGTLLGTFKTIFKEAPSRARRVMKKGDVLISTVRPNLMSHFLVKNDVKDTICSTGFSVVRSHREKMCPGYLYQHLFSSVINNQIEMLISGSNYPAINSRDVRNLRVQIGSLEEQSAISVILEDMDDEIQAISLRLSKTRQIKQGMMQELLTGKTRLV